MKEKSSIESYSIVDYYVIVFDLCSSSIILEDLQNQNQLNKWKEFWEEIHHYLLKSSHSEEKFIIYKFVGDGFILLYKPEYEDILIRFCLRISKIINEKVEEIIEKYLNIRPDRIGMTIGIDKGKLIKFKISKSYEYTGKAINVASRLQSSLKKPEHANKMLISKIVKNKVCINYNSNIYKSVERTLSNLYGDKSFYCYEIDLTLKEDEYIKE